jgi:hypothetical protein
MGSLNLTWRSFNGDAGNPSRLPFNWMTDSVVSTGKVVVIISALPENTSAAAKIQPILITSPQCSPLRKRGGLAFSQVLADRN